MKTILFVLIFSIFTTNVFGMQQLPTTQENESESEKVSAFLYELLNYISDNLKEENLLQFKHVNKKSKELAHLNLNSKEDKKLLKLKLLQSLEKNNINNPLLNSDFIQRNVIPMGLLKLL